MQPHHKSSGDPGACRKTCQLMPSSAVTRADNTVSGDPTVPPALAPPVASTPPGIIPQIAALQAGQIDFRVHCGRCPHGCTILYIQNAEPTGKRPPPESCRPIIYQGATRLVHHCGFNPGCTLTSDLQTAVWPQLDLDPPSVEAVLANTNQCYANSILHIPTSKIPVYRN